jgi:hypothetical protein
VRGGEEDEVRGREEDEVRGGEEKRRTRCTPG